MNISNLKGIHENAKIAMKIAGETPKAILKISFIVSS